MKTVDEYCKVLGIDPSATPKQFKQAYRDLAKVWHPDRFSHDPRLQRKAEEKLKEINEAYQQLQSLFSDATGRGSRSTQAEGGKSGGGQPKTEESPPKQPTESTPVSGSWSLAAWVKKWWLAAAIVLLVVWGAITDHLDQPASIPQSKARREQAFGLAPRSSNEKTKVDPRNDTELARARVDVINKIIETRAGAEKLLIRHESDLDTVRKQYDQRRTQYYLGKISKNEVLQAENELAQAMLRVDEDTRWLLEADLAIKEYTARDELLRLKDSR